MRFSETGPFAGKPLTMVILSFVLVAFTTLSTALFTAVLLVITLLFVNKTMLSTLRVGCDSFKVRGTFALLNTCSSISLDKLTVFSDKVVLELPGVLLVRVILVDARSLAVAAIDIEILKIEIHQN